VIVYGHFDWEKNVKGSKIMELGEMATLLPSLFSFLFFVFGMLEADI